MSLVAPVLPRLGAANEVGSKPPIHLPDLGGWGSLQPQHDARVSVGRGVGGMWKFRKGEEMCRSVSSAWLS